MASDLRWIAELPVVPSVKSEPPKHCVVEAVRFDVAHVTCRGRLYLPTTAPASRDKGPVSERRRADPGTVCVLAHGYCCLQTFEPMNSVIRALVKCGIACLSFDYRNFGESDGQPRQLVDPCGQHEDWHAAVALASRDPRFRQVLLWGTSFSGGHVVAISADLPSVVTATVSWVGCMDFDANHTPVGISTAQFLWRYATNRKGMLKLCGLPGERCLCNGPDEHAEVLYLAKSRGDVEWRNATPLKSILLSRGYKPGLRAPQVQCPILYVSAEHDYITPAPLIQAAAEASPKGGHRSMKGLRHAEVYFPPHIHEIIQHTIAFYLNFIPTHVPNQSSQDDEHVARSPVEGGEDTLQSDKGSKPSKSKSKSNKPRNNNDPPLQCQGAGVRACLQQLLMDIALCLILAIMAVASYCLVCPSFAPVSDLLNNV